MTPSDRLALALCRDRWPSLNCQQACGYCRRNAQAVTQELAALLRERHGHSDTADWLEAIGSHTPEA
ncbi:MAG: hypothetical protein VKO65_01780 [Cyanobacteriota bacterium]|nr:hypothetical protein [Cyanobacteriota bacterium]